MAASETVVLPEAAFARGEFQGPTTHDIPDDHSRVTIEAAYHNWPDTGGEVVRVRGSISLDGKTWTPWFSFGAHGPRPGEDNAPSSVTLPLPPGRGRKLRCWLATAQPLRSKLTVTSF